MLEREFMSQFFGYTPYFGWGFELTIVLMIWGLPALVFLYLSLMLFKYGTKPVKISLASFICLVVVVILYRGFSN